MRRIGHAEARIDDYCFKIDSDILYKVSTRWDLLAGQQFFRVVKPIILHSILNDVLAPSIILVPIKKAKLGDYLNLGIDYMKIDASIIGLIKDLQREGNKVWRRKEDDKRKLTSVKKWARYLN